MQLRALWKVFGRQGDDGCQKRFVGNVAEHVSQVKREWLREEVYCEFLVFPHPPGPPNPPRVLSKKGGSHYLSLHLVLLWVMDLVHCAVGTLTGMLGQVFSSV